MSTYRVRVGDTLSRIAARFKTTVAWLARRNRIANPNRIYAGENLAVPTAKQAPTPVKKAPAPAPKATVPAIVTAAIRRANATMHWTPGMCDNFCANMYGHTASGYQSAVAHWDAIPAAHKHPGDRNAPAGAELFFGPGSHGYGHVTIGFGGSSLRSIDLLNHRYSPGNVSTGTIADIEAWGTLHYLGWADPYYGGKALATLK